MRIQLCVAVAAALPLVACSDEHGHADPDVEACEHLTGGPFTAITATGMADGAPAIAGDHRAYTVTLAPRLIGHGGFVTFAASDATPYIFYLDRAAMAAFTTSTGMPIAPQETTTSVAACSEVMVRHVVPLEVGTAFIELTQDTSTVNIVVEPALVDHEH